MKKITVNGKDYTAKKIDFNGICELEELGLDLAGIKAKSMKAIRALLAYHGNMTEEKAGQEIFEHTKNGGDFSELTEELINTLAGSDFFQTLPNKNDNIVEVPMSETAQIEKE